MRQPRGFQVLLAVLFISFSDGAKVHKRTPPYSIEMRVLVDSHAFDNWKGYVASSTPASQKDAVTRSAMTNYIKSAMNDLNTIFGRLSRSGINIDVRIVSIEFLTEKISYEYDGSVSSSKILDDFKDWFPTQNYSTVDHTMLLTGLDLTTNGNSGTAGVAYTGEMCDTDYSLTVVEAEPTGTVTMTMAHELGHSLSAKHDGDGNSCTTGSHIMEATNEAQGATNQNFRFSSCSVFYFSQYLRGSKSGCLLQTRTPKRTATPLGQLYSPDQMCQMVEGAQSFVCRSFYGEGGQRAYSGICVSALCAKPGQNLCRTIMAADGFVCGRGKRCSLGDCVNDRSAGSNAVTDTCPLGDSPFALSYLRGENCSEAVGSHPGYCYQPYGRRVCCKSCQDARRADAECEYGDRATWCSSLTNIECYPNSAACCATCDKYKTSNPDCKFGDRASWCATLDARYCPLNRAVCCQKCA